MELVRPHLRPDQVVLFACGTFGAALEFLAVLGQDSDVPSIAEFEALPVGGFKSGPAAVRLSGRKRGIGIAFLTDRDRLGLSVVRAFYEDAVPVGSVLETSLGNLNPVLHPPIMILNAGRLKGIPQPFELYTEGVTPSVAKVIDAVDTERLLVGSKFGLPLVPALARLQQWYAGIDRATSIYEAVTSNPAYQHVWAPSALQHRFLTEDVPYGLVPLEGLARLIECDVPITSALVSLTSAMLDTDVRVEGRSIERLGLDGLSRTAILARVTPPETKSFPGPRPISDVP
jgi:opine dehydrogenase